ncbi:hypothetical protein HYE04_03955 [Mycoplasmopsis bovis]|nr:hypothetical protein [Mycoplasmopsis bovis]QQH27714.1 hypothetical protein HYE04_03955 [Mycoplasmopsis bovis]
MVKPKKKRNQKLINQTLAETLKIYITDNDLGNVQVAEQDKSNKKKN